MTRIEVPGWFYSGLKRLEDLINDQPSRFRVDFQKCPDELACGFAALGAHMPLDAACERAVLKRLLPKIRPFTRKPVSDTRDLVGCIYECLMFSFAWRAGFAPSFLGKKNADFESKTLGLLFECKDVRAEHSLNEDVERATRTIADWIRDADHKLKGYDPSDKYLHIALIDLPEGTHEWLSQMSKPELSRFWRGVLADDETGAVKSAAWRTIFTTCDTLHTLGKDPSARKPEVRIMHPVILARIPAKLAGVLNDLYHAFGTTPFVHLAEAGAEALVEFKAPDR